MPGGHSSMLQEPNVQVLAECLQDLLDGIEKSTRYGFAAARGCAIGRSDADVPDKPRLYPGFSEADNCGDRPGSVRSESTGENGGR